MDGWVDGRVVVARRKVSACLLHSAHPSLFFPTTVGAGLLTIPVAVPSCLVFCWPYLVDSQQSQSASERASSPFRIDISVNQENQDTNEPVPWFERFPRPHSRVKRRGDRVQVHVLCML